MTTPKLELVAKPRLGKRAVTLSQITHWIERKLCSLVDVSIPYVCTESNVHYDHDLCM